MMTLTGVALWLAMKPPTCRMEGFRNWHQEAGKIRVEVALAETPCRIPHSSSIVGRNDWGQIEIRSDGAVTIYGNMRGGRGGN